MKFIHEPQTCDSHLKPQRPKRKRHHVPHNLRPKEAVTKRNERERRRVNDVNGAFVELQKHLPLQNFKIYLKSKYYKMPSLISMNLWTN